MKTHLNNLSLPPEYQIRIARLEDAEGIAFVHTMAWKSAYKGIIDPLFLETLKLENRLELRHKILREGKGIYYVALWEDKIIGFCDADVLRFHENQQLSPEQQKARTERGEVYALYILEHHQGQRVGNALFQNLRLQMKKQGLVPFLAWALKDNHKARKFYEHQGGKLVDEISVRIKIQKRVMPLQEKN